MRVALIQLSSGDNPAENLAETLRYVNQAAGLGAEFILTPEVTNCVSTSRSHQQAVLTSEEHDLTLQAIRDKARTLGVWVLIGSLALKTDDPNGRFANRSFLVSPMGDIAARYDKIHMFDVDVSETESYRESKGYRPGTESVLATIGETPIGLTICYDLRFPYLYRALAQAGAKILTVPSAFAQTTGEAHWHVLLRARAIETGSFLLAPAQCGQNTPKRSTFGHSLAVSPWGDILADGGTESGVTMVDLDLDDVEKSRQRIPSLRHDREFSGPA